MRLERFCTHRICPEKAVTGPETRGLDLQAERAFVHPKYWNGKCFLPVDKVTPPYLTFPGAATFAYVRAS